MHTIKSFAYIKKIFLFTFFGVLGGLAYSQSLKEREAVAEGNRQYLQKNYSAAMADYAKALVENENNVKANFNIGNVFFETKQYEKATQYFLKAAQNSENTKIKAEAYHNMGNALMQSHKYKEAVKAYKMALRNNPSDNQTRYNLALARKLQQEKKKQDPQDLPKPSEFAKKMKMEADKLAAKGEFSKAYSLMNNALLKDSTVNHFQDYIKKLNEVIILDTIK